MKQNISELAQTIYRVKQESDKVLDLHFARVFKKSIIKEHQFYVPINRNNLTKLDYGLRKSDDKIYLVVFTDLCFVRINDNVDAVKMKMYQILKILEQDTKIYGITINPFHKEYGLEISRKNFSNIWLSKT
ncbi:MAG: SseB family protein [Neisseriaceae bacterium]|nr:SseB family protein [Neisseriaceae bacterium]MBR5940662.1 SseB family protein [Neisseriaceae bacterium]